MANRTVRLEKNHWENLKMRWLVIGILLILGVILSWFNWQPITLYFLGNSSQTALFSCSLPLALWILIFTLAGLITGFIIQFLSQLYQPAPSFRHPRRRFDPPSSKATPLRNSSPSEPDWEQKLPDEWDIEEPPQDATRPQYRNPSKPKLSQNPPQDALKSDLSENPPILNQDSPQSSSSSPVEVPQIPQENTREGSVYRYTYRDKENSDRLPRRSKSEPTSVYDAPYRVITPPNTTSEEGESPNEEEDWI